LRVLFCGINPGLVSAAKGQHFARPGNRFWPALHLAGFTPRQLLPAEQADLLHYGLGITNLVNRATARAEELSREELVAGTASVRAKVTKHRPAWLAVVGITAYRMGFDDRTARLGLQSAGIGRTGVWVLPNPSGLNARFQIDDLAAEFARLRTAAIP
jgi:TDG/mug DNA glycosylase family protein